MPNEKPQKTERVTIRLSEETKAFIETFSGETFSASFQSMIESFSGKKTDTLREEIKNSESRVKSLQKEGTRLCTDVNAKLKNTLGTLSAVEKLVNRAHDTMQES